MVFESWTTLSSHFQPNTYFLTQSEIEEKAALDSLQYGPYGLCFYYYATQGKVPRFCEEEGIDFETGDLSDYSPEKREQDLEYLDKLEVHVGHIIVEVNFP